MPTLMYDTFKLANKRLINNEDINSLTKLYLPLMGMDSYALYLGLSTLDTNVSYNFKYLIDTLGLKSLSSINKASAKLEGLGLLDVYQNKDNDVIYFVNRVRTINEFLNEEVLRNLLISEIGSDAVINLMNNEIDLKGYKKITKSFSDVFTTTTNEPFDLLEKYAPKDIEITNKDFNYSLFKMLFETGFVSEEKLNDQEFMANIYKLSYIWHLNEEQMKDVVMLSVDKDSNLDYNTLSVEAKKEFNRINKNKDARIITLEKDDYLDSIKDDQMLSLCTKLESLSPSELLEYKNGGIKPSGAEIKLMEDLINNTKFSVGVINFMVMMVLQEKDGKMPSYDYFEKIANTWARAKIKTIPDAVKYLDKQNKEIEKANKVNTKKEATKPDWYDDYDKELNKKLEENKELSNDKVKEILDEAKDLFGD